MYLCICAFSWTKTAQIYMYIHTQHRNALHTPSSSGAPRPGVHFPQLHMQTFRYRDKYSYCTSTKQFECCSDVRKTSSDHQAKYSYFLLQPSSLSRYQAFCQLQDCRRAHHHVQITLNGYD